MIFNFNLVSYLVSKSIKTVTNISFNLNNDIASLKGINGYI